MPLSTDKLQDLILSKGFIPKAFFTMDGLCFYVELYCSKSAETFFLYIPSKYSFEVPKGNDAFKIFYVNQDFEGIDSNDDEAERHYGDVHIELDRDQENVKEHLENNYKHQIKLKEISTDDKLALREIYGQVKRLRYSVQNLNYKIGILYKDYFCAMRRDDTISCFRIKSYPYTPGKKLVVITDLESLYKKSSKIGEDVRVVKGSIYRILGKNQGIHTNMLERMLSSKKDIPVHTEAKHMQYMGWIAKIENMLDIMNNAERKAYEELDKIKENGSEGIHGDIANAHNRAKLEKDLEKMGDVKKQIVQLAQTIRAKCDSDILTVDTILFENNVMWERMANNFAKLKEFC